MKSIIKIERNKSWQKMTITIDRPWKETYHPNTKQMEQFFEKLEKGDGEAVVQNGHKYEIIGSRFTYEGNKVYYLMRDNENIPCAFIDPIKKRISTRSYADQTAE